MRTSTKRMIAAFMIWQAGVWTIVLWTLAVMGTLDGGTPDIQMCTPHAVETNMGVSGEMVTWKCPDGASVKVGGQ